MIKEIIINNNTYFFVEVPEDAYDYRYKTMPDDAKQLVATIKDDNGNVGTCYIRENPNGEIISTTKDITKEQADNIIESQWGTNYKDYTKVGKQNNSFMFKTIKESLQTLIQTNGLDISKNYLILKQNDIK